MWLKSLIGVMTSALLFAHTVSALELPGELSGEPADTANPASASTESTIRNHQPNENLDNIAREIRKYDQWRILDWKPKFLDKKTVYQFKLLDQKRGRVQVIEVDPARPQLELLGN